MKSIAFICVLCLGSLRTWADDAPHQPKPVSSADRAPDLDFSNDDETRKPVPSPAAPVSHGHSWIYWTLGFTATAGGLTWYLLRDIGKGPTTTKSVQVFTDAPN